MKLKNKLIPLATGLAVCTAVTPIAISCGTNSNSEFVDITGRYAPKFDIYDGTDALTSLEATSVYAQKCKDTKAGILIDDILWSLTNKGKDKEVLMKPNLVENRSIKSVNNGQSSFVANRFIKVTDTDATMMPVKVKFDDPKTKQPVEKEYNIPVVSFKVEYYSEFDINKDGRIVDEPSLTYRKQTGTVELKNIPFFVRWLSSYDSLAISWRVDSLLTYYSIEAVLRPTSIVSQLIKGYIDAYYDKADVESHINYTEDWQAEYGSKHKTAHHYGKNITLDELWEETSSRTLFSEVNKILQGFSGRSHFFWELPRNQYDPFMNEKH